MNAGDMDYMGATIHVMRGLPRSGKSTMCADLLKQGGVVVSGDAVRLAIHGKPFVDWLEPEVYEISKYMVTALLYSGHHVIILDECFLTAQSVAAVRREWPQAEVVEHLVPTPPDICIARAMACGQEYLVPVIKDMAEKAEWRHQWDESLAT